MNLKKIKIIAVFGIFILCFVTHFLYKWFPNSLFSIFFPVNESIWEHMKMIFTTIIIYGIIDFLLLEKTKIQHNNYFLSLFLSAISSIVIYLSIFLPLYYNGINNMFITILVLFITIILTQIISFNILKLKQYKILNYLSSPLIILVFIIMGYLTYHPIRNHLFFDTEEEKYGINNYNI